MVPALVFDPFAGRAGTTAGKRKPMIRALAAPGDTTTPTPTIAPVADNNPLSGATETTLPGLATFKGLVLGLIPYALVACVAALLIVALAAALLVGGAAYLVGWFNSVGKTVSAPASVVQTVAPADPARSV